MPSPASVRSLPEVLLHCHVVHGSSLHAPPPRSGLLRPLPPAEICVAQAVDHHPSECLHIIVTLAYVDVGILFPSYVALCDSPAKWQML